MTADTAVLDDLVGLLAAINDAADARRRTLLNRGSWMPLTDEERQQLVGYSARLERLWQQKRRLLADRPRRPGPDELDEYCSRAVARLQALPPEPQPVGPWRQSALWSEAS